MSILCRASLRSASIASAIALAAACGGSTATTEDLADAGGAHTSAGSTSGSGSSGAVASGATSGTGPNSATPSASIAITNASSSGVAMTTIAGGTTTTTAAGGSNTCNTLTPTEAATLTCGMGAQPAFTGGAIASGSYNVTTVEIYPPDGGKNICGFIGDVSVKGAATVSGSELQLVLVVGPPANDTIGFDGTYVENGHSLVVTPTCGASSTSTQTLQYTATASTLVIDAQIMGYTGLITLALAP